MACSQSSDVKVSPHDKEILNQIFNPGLPYGDEVDDDGAENVEAVEETEAIKKSKELEVQGVKAAEAGDVDGAITFFGRAVVEAPDWPSAYNNRAQALRLKGDDEGAKRDLEKALELSQHRGTVACQAFTQRGLLRKRAGDDDGAKEDFQRAAELGGGFAKQLLASMNPYAALCNQMLGDVMQKLRAGQGEI
ncbi:tetratricopeptide repeat protein 36 [Aplysia californica]|uniref:Tetratricopeptide repeat protein 36 n=1 Tax=Aplysia californica TaxID=6500 RepID=A0ABM0K6G6_APLCA|nr:tetratricopeptide repeat protein 36 [Aplysia californica]